MNTYVPYWSQEVNVHACVRILVVIQQQLLHLTQF